MPLPGVSITLTICPSFNSVVCNSHEVDTAEELALDLKTFLPRMVLPVALLPLPVRPTKTTVRPSLDEEVSSQSSPIELPPITNLPTLIKMRLKILE